MEEQRRHLRLLVESKVFIELISPEVGSTESGKIAVCKTLDVSRGGLRVSLEYELVTDAILQIGIELPGSAETLYLAGEVKWCHANQPPESGWSAGFAILNADGSDVANWVTLLAGMES